VNVVADAILSLTETEQAYLWENFRQQNEQLFGIDPLLFGDFSPKIDPIDSGEWPELTPKSLAFVKDMQGAGGFPLGFVEMVLSGRTVDLLPSGASIGGSSAAVEKKPEEKKVEKTVWNLMLMGFQADKKVPVIKEVKNTLGIGLKEAKDQVEGAAAVPVLLIKNLEKAAAEEAVKKFTDLGAVVELT
jgi:ribosomal protein L7/L12